MELKDLTGAMLVLLLTAILVGVGIMILDNLSKEVKTTTAYADNRFNATNTSCVDLTQSYIDSTSATFENATDGQAVSSGCFVWDNTERRSGSCVTLSTLTACNVYHYKFINTSYNYAAANSASNSVDNTGTAINTVPNWFVMLVVIISASIIIGLVIRSFGAGRIE
jgi:hypothetical protein